MFLKSPHWKLYILCHLLSTLLNNLSFPTYSVGFEVVAAVVMKSTIFWDVKPCSPLKVNR
jgi:hypothetical protein